MRVSLLYTKLRLDILLAALAIVCVGLMFVTSDDPIMPFLQDKKIAFVFKQFDTGNQILFDLSVGVLSAILMFYLLVRLPEYERKQRIKRQLNISYASFKRSMIQIFVGLINGSYNAEVVESLMVQRNFRDYFKEQYCPGQERWHGVANEMNDFVLRQIVLEVDVLHSEFQHALSALDIKDPEVFTFMKLISVTLYRAKNWSSDYEGTKEMLQFFWGILAGWSHSVGYVEDEYIPRMIAKL